MMHVTRYARLFGCMALVMSLVAAGRADAPVEQWSTAEGFTIEAAFVELRDDQLTLRRPDGEEIRVPLDELGEESRKQAAERAGSDDGKGLRTWTSASGMALRARYEAMDGADLVLVREDGSQVKIGLDRLSEADQALARKLAGEAEAAIKIETGPNKLPVFTSGRWRGYHAVYEHALFDALMDVNGVIWIHLKDGDRKIDPPLSFNMSCYFHDGRTRVRPVKEFIDPPAPVMQPNEITLAGLLALDIPFEVTFEFDGDTLAGWGWCKDHDKVPFNTRFRILLRVPPSHDIAPQVPQEERIKMVEGYELTLREVTGRGTTRTTYNYYDAVRFRHSARDATVVSPQWAPRVVHARAGSSRLPLRPWIYADRSLWQGYVLQLIKDEQDTRQRSQRIEVRIE